MVDTSSFAAHTLGQPILALALGAAVMILLALAAERFFARAAVRRLLWQGVLLALGGLIVFELTGAAHAVSALLATAMPAETVQGGRQSRGIDTDRSIGRESPVPDVLMAGSIQEPLQLEVPFGSWHAPETASCGEPLLPEDEMVAMQLPTNVWLQSVVPPVVEPAEPEFAAENAGEEPAAEGSMVPVPAAGGSPSPLPLWAASILVLVWVAGVCLFAGRAILARLKLRRLRQQWGPNQDQDLQRLVDDLRGRMGMGRRVRIRQAAGLPAPVAFGIVHPTVLLPVDFSKRFSLPQQQVILAHELAHLAEGDPAWLLVGELMTALFWWHPLAHTARRRLLTASEQAADEASALVPNGPDVLAACLVQLGRSIKGRPRFGWVAAEGSGLRSGLAHRVQRLLELSENSARLPAGRVPRAARPAAIVLLMVLTISCTLWVHPKASFAKGEETMNVLKVSWRQSLAAAALTVFLGPLATEIAADDSPAAPSKPAQLEQGSPADQLLLAQEEEGDRGKGEARGDRQRGEREAGGDRPRRETQRDAEHRDGERGERAEGERGDQREHPEGARDEIRRRVEQLERERAELQQKSGQAARELEDALRKTEEERQKNTRHLAELEEVVVKLKKEPREDGAEAKLAEVSKELEKARDIAAELAKRADNLNREMAEHRTNVQRHMAELERALAEVRVQQARMEADSAPGNPERTELLKRIQEIAAKAAELQRAGKTEEAETLRHEMRELHARLGGPRDPGRPGPREGMERLEAMEGELGKLREAGKLDAAERLEGELQELRRRLAAPREGDRPGPPPELQVRIDHLRVAMENLHAAGLPDQAEQIARQIEQIIRQHAPGPPERRVPDARPHQPRPEGQPLPGAEIVGQLRGEMEQLRRENEELRQMMKEIREAQERLMNELRQRR